MFEVFYSLTLVKLHRRPAAPPVFTCYQNKTHQSCQLSGKVTKVTEVTEVTQVNRNRKCT